MPKKTTTTAKRARRTRRKKAPDSKVCASCLERKSLEDFGDNPRMALGKKSYCRPCSARLQREWNANKKKREAEKKGRRKKTRGRRGRRRTTRAA